MNTPELDMLNRVYAQLTRWFLSVTRLNAVHLADSYVTKRRFWYSPVIILICNIIMKWRKAPVRILSKSEWCLWETYIYRATGRSPVHTKSKDGLVIPRAKGSTIEEILQFSRETAKKRSALRGTIIALKRLHDRNLSHGDATVRNAAYDPSQDSAEWFDFEQCYYMNLDSDTKEADDLRALIFSAAAHLDQEELDYLISIALNEYKKSTLARLFDIVNDPNLGLDLYHLSQSGSSFAKQRNCKTILLGKLRHTLH